MNGLVTERNLPSTSGEKAQISSVTQQEQALFFMAQHVKRDVSAIRDEIAEHCKRLKFAETSLYAYSRGRNLITGPSRSLIDTITQCFGHIGSGTSVLNVVSAQVEGNKVLSKGYSDVLCMAVDRVKCNTKYRVIRVYHWRDTRDGGYRLSDERDIAEQINNYASRALRVCQEKLIPDDIIDEAVEMVNDTMRQAHKTPLADRVKELVKLFDMEFDITKAMLEKRLGRAIETISETEMVPYRAIVRNLRDGVSRPDEFFDMSMVPPASRQEQKKQSGGSKKGKGGKSAEAETAAPPPAESDKPVDAEVEQITISDSDDAPDLSEFFK